MVPVCCSSERDVLGTRHFGGPAGPQDTPKPVNTSTLTLVAEAHQYCFLRQLAAAISQHIST